MLHGEENDMTDEEAVKVMEDFWTELHAVIEK